MRDIYSWPDEDLSESDEHRLNNVEWTTINALREMLGIALKGKNTPTYQQALEFGKSISPEIFSSPKSILGREQEELIILEYRQRASAKSQVENREIQPIDIVDDEIKEYERLLNTNEEHPLIRRRLGILEGIRQRLQPKQYTENQLILRDLFKAERNLPKPAIEKDTYREFHLSEGRALRIRLLHPDPPEHSIGADLVYEQYWEKKQLARIALIQYKIWDGKTLYFSNASNVEAQMEKLQSQFCHSGLCDAFDGSKRSESYRLPYCTVFLRPTDRLQNQDSRLISSGLHIPICAIIRNLKDTKQGNKKLERKYIRGESLSHKVFEEIFNINMLGSRWLNYSELENLYKTHGIFKTNERIVIHAQDFGFPIYPHAASRIDSLDDFPPF